MVVYNLTILDILSRDGVYKTDDNKIIGVKNGILYSHESRVNGLEAYLTDNWIKSKYELLELEEDRVNKDELAINYIKRINQIMPYLNTLLYYEISLDTVKKLLETQEGWDALEGFSESAENIKKLMSN